MKNKEESMLSHLWYLFAISELLWIELIVTKFYVEYNTKKRI